MRNKFVERGRASVIVGGQFGSESKGLVAAHIADRLQDIPERLIVTTNAGAQAGHTTVLPDGAKFVCYHLPTAGVLINHAHIYLNAGAIIDLELLNSEVDAVAAALNRDPKTIWERLIVHPCATIITDAAKQIERDGATQHLGSTQKGVGAALAAKIMRDPRIIARTHKLPATIDELDLHGQTVIVEIPQGTSLSLNSSGFYPNVTSRECWVGQGLVDAAIHPSTLGVVNMVMRTFPIRVGHIYDNDSTFIIGHSGPFYGDGDEIEWDELPGIMPERTTVTRRIRRIAKWSRQQYRHSLRLNRPNNVFLTFTNYTTQDELRDIIISMRSDEDHVGLSNIRHYYSFGPSTDQIVAHYEGAREHCRDA